MKGMIYQFDKFTCDTDSMELRRGGEVTPVEPQAFTLLCYLLENRDRVVSKEDLIGAIWSGRVVSDGAITFCVNSVRQALGDTGRQQALIRTVPKKGYRFVGKVAAVQNQSEEVGSDTVGVDPFELPRATTDRKGRAITPAIAVLPFANLSGDPEQEYFADGVVEDIITSLARIKWLLVIARNSSFTYKGQPVASERIGTELGVQYLLQGSLRKTEERVRVSVQLVDTETGAHLWADRFDRPLEEIFAVQDAITLSVVGALEPTLREAEIERVTRRRPDNLGAYDLMLRALPHVFTAMPEEVNKAVPLLEKAISIEPQYAVAHGYLAWANEILVRSGAADRNRLAAIEHAHSAIDFGRDDATALALGGFVTAMVEHDRDTAFDVFDQALTISPSSALTLYFGSGALAYGGEADRAIEWAERALRVSPFDRLNYFAYHALAIGHFQCGRFQQAASAARRAVQSSPHFSVSHTLLAAALVGLGLHDEAKAAAARVLQLQPSYSASGFCSALGLPEKVAAPLMKAWRKAGLPA